MDIYQDRLLKQGQQILKGIAPGNDATQLQKLLNQLIHYQLRVRGITSIGIPSDSPFFNSQTTLPSLDLAAEIDYRLALLASYQLSKPKRIVKTLMAGLQIEKPPQFTQLQIRLLTEMHQDSRVGTVNLSKTLHVSPRTINQQKHELLSAFGARTAAVIDPHRFGLVHVGVWFRANSPEASQSIEHWIFQEAHLNGALPFLHGFGFDVNQQNGLLMLYLPDERRVLTQFNQTLEKLADSHLESYEIIPFQGFFSNVNFNTYDYVSQQWQITSDLRTEGTRRFIEEYGPQFPPPRGSLYQKKPLAFTQADWILALSICEGLVDRKDRQHIIASHGFPFANKTGWAHEHRLENAQAYIRYLTFSNLLFAEIICIIVVCETSMVDFFHQFSTQFAMSRLMPTPEGVVVFIGIPTQASSFINQLIHTLIDIPGLRNIDFLRLKRNLPSTPPIHTFHLWNPSPKRWSYPKYDD
ncbi:MAG: hypothetical protein ACFE9D_07615 [Promethearchaeota archaeon]